MYQTRIEPRILSFMRKRPRKLRILKWAGLVVCGLLVLTIVLSVSWKITWRGGNYFGFVQCGGIGLAYYDRLPGSVRSGVGLNGPEASFVWWVRYQPPVQPSLWFCIIPLWMPLVLIAAPTIWAWRRDRRIPPGHCRECGYDLTGNVSGVCPECGTEIKPP